MILDSILNSNTIINKIKLKKKMKQFIYVGARVGLDGDRVRVGAAVLAEGTREGDGVRTVGAAVDRVGE